MPKYQVRTVPGDSLHQKLAAAIVKAWTDATYKRKLLTFPDGGWEGMSQAERDERIRGTRGALDDPEIGISLDKPVVLTIAQFAKYEMATSNEIVFVLPEADKGTTLKDAKDAMDVHALGV